MRSSGLVNQMWDLKSERRGSNPIFHITSYVTMGGRRGGQGQITEKQLLSLESQNLSLDPGLAV